jgi:hypothetical protein
MVGTFQVAAELASMGHVPLLTSRNTRAADIVLFSERTSRDVVIQVKTVGVKTSDTFWLLSEGDRGRKPENFFYVLIKLQQRPRPSDFYVLPARVIRQRMKRTQRRGSVWYQVYKRAIVSFKDRWDLIEYALRFC